MAVPVPFHPPFLASAAMLTAVLTGATALAATASAAPAATASLTLKGTAAHRLHAARVQVLPTGSATRSGSVLTLPIASSRVGATATTTLAGGVRFRAAGRSVTATVLRATVSPRRVIVTATMAGVRTTLAIGTPSARRRIVDTGTGTVLLTVPGARLGTGAAGAIARRLHLRRSPTGTVGTLRVAVAAKPAATPDPPAGEEPYVARPGDSVDVVRATVVWHVRDSFIQYINAGEGTTPSGGTTADPPSSGCTTAGAVNDAQLAYQFRFPLRTGWYQPSTGRTGLVFTGAVNFHYRDHTIDLDVKNPELDLNGAASQAVFRFSGTDGTDIADTRAPLIDLAPGTPRPAQCAADPGPRGITDTTGAVNADGTRTYAYERVPGAVAAGATDSVFAGYGYFPGDPFGWITVSFTVAAPVR